MILIHVPFISRIRKYRRNLLIVLKMVAGNRLWTQSGNLEELLRTTIRGEEETVARMIENAHQENTSILAYNDENSLACVIALAYYSAKKNYVVYRELAGGKGFADMVFVPRKNDTDTGNRCRAEMESDSGSSDHTDQKGKQYVESLKDYRGEVILVGINYESKELKKDDYKKKHSCKIERITMA